MTQQQAFTTCKNAWNAHAWSDDETIAWQLFSNHHPIKNAIGETRYLFPYTSFLSVNISRVMNLDPILFWPPW